jgi:hypothetical protein
MGENIELVDREPLLAYSKLEKRLLALCHQYGTLSEDSFSGDDFSTLEKNLIMKVIAVHLSFSLSFLLICTLSLYCGTICGTVIED